MRWPFVSRAAYDFALLQLDAARAAGMESTGVWAAEARHWHERHDALLEKYHALAKLMVGAPPHIPETPAVEPLDDMPPQVVLDAMRRISPYRDKTYDANWAYWEANKGRAKDHPEDFANEILEGFTEPDIRLD